MIARMPHAFRQRWERGRGQVQWVYSIVLVEREEGVRVDDGIYFD